MDSIFKAKTILSISLNPCPLFYLLVTSSLAVQSAEIETSRQLSLETSYIDNIDLLRNGGRSDFVTQINPEFMIDMESARLTGTASYRLQNLFYYSHTDLNETYHQFSANTIASPIPDKFRIQTVASYDQQTISFDSPFGSDDNLTGAENRSDRAVIGIEPVWTSHLGKRIIAELTGSYYLTQDEFDSDSLGYGVNIYPFPNNIPLEWRQYSLGYGVNIYPFPNNIPLEWRLSLQQRDIDYENNQERETRQYAGFFSYPVSSLLSAVTELGYESDESGAAQISRKESGLFYSVGFHWFPRRSVDINLNYEDHYYGDFVSTNISYQKNRMVFELSYDQEVTTNRDQDIGNLLSAPGSSLSPIQSNSTDTFLQETLDLSTTYTYPRGTLSFTTRFDNRKTENEILPVSRPEEEITELRIEWNHELTRQHSVNLALMHRDREVSGGVDDRDLGVSSSLTYQISPDISGNLYLSTNDRSADVRSSEYSSSIVGIVINITY